MKIDRLIGIVMYLLNRDKVTARELADKFEVSTRTVLRDMETLGAAGIPVFADLGINGGYSILDTYKLNKSITSAEDYLNIITSLKGMCSAYENRKIEETLEKVMACGNVPKPRNQKIFLDLGICREGENTDAYLKLLEQAMAGCRAVGFDYTGADGICRSRVAEPLALSYRWYAWYLLAYCRLRKDYRIFKINRMENLKALEEGFGQCHPDSGPLLEQKWNSDSRKRCTVKLRCRAGIRAAVREYVKGTITAEFEDGDFEYSFTVPENERMMFSLLLGFGSEAEVLEPLDLRERLREKAEEICEMYRNCDIQMS